VYYRRNPEMLFYLIKCRARGDGAAAIATVARMGVEVFTVSDGGPAQFRSGQLPSANAGGLLARSR